MANVFKNGTVKGTGKANANILPGTSAKEVQYTSWIKEILEKYF